jgi:hypothetical protein
MERLLNSTPGYRWISALKYDRGDYYRVVVEKEVQSKRESVGVCYTYVLVTNGESIGV